MQCGLAALTNPIEKNNESIQTKEAGTKPTSNLKSQRTFMIVKVLWLFCFLNEK